MADVKTETKTDWDPEMLRELDMADNEPSYRDEVPIGGLEAFEDLPFLDRNADFGACRHSVADDDDCVECRTNGCSGGSDCACSSAVRGLRRLLEVA